MNSDASAPARCRRADEKVQKLHLSLRPRQKQEPAWRTPSTPVSFLRQLPVWGGCMKELSLLAREWRYSPRQGVQVLQARASVMLLTPRVNRRPH